MGIQLIKGLWSYLGDDGIMFGEKCPSFFLPVRCAMKYFEVKLLKALDML